MRRAWAGIVATAIAIALSGCFGLPLHKTDVDKIVNEEAAAIFVGETDRSTLRQKLGEPLAARAVRREREGGRARSRRHPQQYEHCVGVLRSRQSASR